MKTKFALTADDVAAVLAAAREHATANGWKVTISVVDDGGHLLGLLRLDGAAPMTAVIAPGKARTAAVGQKESRGYEETINGGRYAFLSVPDLVFMEGGVPIVADGQVVGAVGVSGVKSAQDAEIAKAGIAALKLA
ncbi:MAG TPA: heme-binding protein [Castellaniella sp.]|uniref:heme-binding protein n=1 Tax=Castellaniella sp. TaxID=1955812 RepID=UPI002EE39F00